MVPQSFLPRRIGTNPQRNLNSRIIAHDLFAIQHDRTCTFLVASLSQSTSLESCSSFPRNHPFRCSRLCCRCRCRCLDGRRRQGLRPPQSVSPEREPWQPTLPARPRWCCSRAQLSRERHTARPASKEASQLIFLEHLRKHSRKQCHGRLGVFRHRSSLLAKRHDVSPVLKLTLRGKGRNQFSREAHGSSV